MTKSTIFLIFDPLNKKDIHAIRAFNRFYTRVIGLLDKYLLHSHYTLPEVRVMYEIHQHKKISSKAIAKLLGMDKGYLSRMLQGFDKKGLISTKASETDARMREISLTSKGEQDFLEINRATDQQIISLLSQLTKEEIQALILHMQGIQKIFSNLKT